MILLLDKTRSKFRPIFNSFLCFFLFYVHVLRELCLRLKIIDPSREITTINETKGYFKTFQYTLMSKY